MGRRVRVATSNFTSLLFVTFPHRLRLPGYEINPLSLFTWLQRVAASFHPGAGLGGGGGGAGGDRGSFERSGTFANRHGTGTFSQSVQRGNGTATRDTTWQYSNGKTGDRDVTNTYNKSTGQFTHDASTTYANGKTS